MWGCLNDFMKEMKPGRPRAGRGGSSGARWVVSAEKTRVHTDVVGVSGSDGSFTAMFPYGREDGNEAEEPRASLENGTSVVSLHRMASEGEGD